MQTEEVEAEQCQEEEEEAEEASQIVEEEVHYFLIIGICKIDNR